MAEASRIDFSDAIRYLNENVHRFDKSKGDGVKLLAREIAGTLAATTRVAPKTRTIVKRKPGTKVRSGTLYAKRPTADGFRFLAIRADSTADAKQSKLAKIGKRGLAKSAWFWVLSELGGRAGRFTAGAGVRKSRNAYGVLNRMSGLDPAILIENKLEYASEAFKTKGRATVDNAGERALNRVKRIVERQVARAP